MFTDYSLYLVTGEETSLGRSTVEVVEAALTGGVDIVQMREKNLFRKELLTLGEEVAKLCRDNNALFIVNDDPFIAKDLGAREDECEQLMRELNYSFWDDPVSDERFNGYVNQMKGAFNDS